MKNKKVSILLTILLCMVGTKALAYDFAVENADGITIYYNYTDGGKGLEVTRRSDSNNAKYSGSIVIPEEVTYMNRTRKVTRIGSYAFYQCFDLTNVIMPSSVTSIGEYAFNNCHGITSLTIPINVTTIEKGAFSCCNFTSITIPNSVTVIDDSAFDQCSNLTTLTLGNSVTTIGNYAFTGCTSLSSLTIPNSVTKIGIWAFQGCSSITTLTIGNSVTTIGRYAFSSCSNLTTLTIPNSVTSIGENAFNGCDYQTVISKIENPMDTYDNMFNPNTFNNATLYVPKGTIDKYKSRRGWWKFLFIEEGDGSGNTPTDTKKCEKPTISYKNGLLTYHCATEEAICHSTITDTDIKSYSGNEVQLCVTYEISVYATKAGYENSETATATLCWIDVEPKTEGIENGIAHVRANAVLIQAENGNINITGTNDGTKIYVYGIDGQQVGSSMSYDGQASINTNLQSGSIAIVNIGDKNVKIVMK